MPAVKSKPKPPAKPKPQAAIRRFDIFAEYNRDKAMGDGMPAEQAKGYGLWLAKIVAARRFRKSTPDDKAGAAHDKAKPARRTKWRSLSGVPQTAKLFDKEIVGRMGSQFYRQVFAPAVRDAFKRGQTYESIRDSLRVHWKPED